MCYDPYDDEPQYPRYIFDGYGYQVDTGDGRGFQIEPYYSEPVQPKRPSKIARLKDLAKEAISVLMGEEYR